jgi:hypothetical protein
VSKRQRGTVNWVKRVCVDSLPSLAMCSVAGRRARRVEAVDDLDLDNEPD